MFTIIGGKSLESEPIKVGGGGGEQFIKNIASQKIIAGHITNYDFFRKNVSR